MTKQSLGQFFTTNVDHILSGFEDVVNGKCIYDPFAGRGDLLNWASKNGASETSGSDIDDSLVSSFVSKNDSLLHIKQSEFILTNPPYLAQNKMSVDQKSYLTNSLDDFYSIAMYRIVESGSPEGIIIVPVNFLSAENTQSIRRMFFERFEIRKLKYFIQQVFDDTSYNVIAFHFVIGLSKRFTMEIIPGASREFEIDSNFNIKNDTIAAIRKQPNLLRCNRIIDQDLTSGDNEIICSYNDFETKKSFSVDDTSLRRINNSIMVLNCIDKRLDPISIEDVRTHNTPCLIGKVSSRNIASVSISISIDEQERLIPIVNNLLTKLRDETFSMFLTNFRDGNRKRISFDFFYQLINYCYFKILHGAAK